jgi:VRR-NUC domain-containing protein
MQETETRQPLKGRDLQKAIIELARRRGWMVAHTPPVRTEHGWRTPVAADGKGWPDLVLVRDRILFREVKGDTDTLKPEQRQWQSALKIAGADVDVWSPEDWTSGRIEDELTRRRVA